MWALVITSVAGFMAALDNLVVTTALPSIREDLGGSLPDLEWTVSAYTLTFAVLLMFGAALGDRFGRRRLFLVGITIFTGASAAAALAPGLDSLIAARAVQGVGVMASIFSAQGGYETGQTFVDGLRPALVTGAAVVALAGVAALLIPGRRHAGAAAAQPLPERELQTASH